VKVTGWSYLRDPALHDEEIWIVNIQLYTLEQGLNGVLLRFVTIEEVLGYIWKRNLRI
jgi:hypothetical protein